QDNRVNADGTDTVIDAEFLQFSDLVEAIGGGIVTNHAPDGAVLATTLVDENAAVGTLVGTVVGSDPDAGDTLTYSLTDDAGGRFVIDSASGALTVAAGAAIDYEAAASHAIGVRVSDAAGAFSDFAFTISVGNRNDVAPVFSSAATFAMAENATVVGTVVAADPEALGSISYALTGGADAALFSIDAATGALAFVAAPNFELPGDAGADNIYDVTVTASDGGGSTGQALAISVGDLLEVPTMVYAGTTLADVFSVVDGNGWTMSGNSGNDTLTGGALADVLIGGKGNDALAGGDGDDVFKFAAGDGTDSISGGAGYDKLVATTANAVIGISALSGIEAISSGGFAGTSIIGSTLADTLDFSGIALSGIVSIDAGSGNDTVTGSAAADTIVLGSGNDVFNGAAGDDLFVAKASSGTDAINGGAGFDTIRAGANNVIIGFSALAGIEAVDGASYT
ncbi:MAG: cadherin domain-containing protein, partial [Polymorphobacter sp.]